MPPKQKEQTQMRQYPANAFKRQKKADSLTSIQATFNQKTKSQTSQPRLKQKGFTQLNQSELIRQNDAQSYDQSQQDNLQRQAQDIVNQLRKAQQIQKANNKVVVGSGFSFDITQFFKFQKKKELDSSQGDLFAEITGSVLAWVILLYSVINTAMIPSWIMNIKATKLLRISWRFMLQSLIIFPFVMYERRISDQETKKQYSFWHIINPVHLKKVYVSSVATSIWFTVILTVFQWTFVSHGIMLGSLSNFFLSIHRSITKSEHDLQSGGRYCVILGIGLVLYDAYRFDPTTATEFQKDVVNPFYLNREWYHRVAADLIAMFISFTMSRFSRYTSDLKSHYPPYLSMFLVNIFMMINMAFSTYFFNGLTFDTDPRFGFFSIFSQAHFAGFLYMSIVLCFGMFVSSILISKLFSDPILPALAMTLDPVLATILLEWAGIQTMPKAYTFIGYLFIVPGMLLILVGQCLYQRTKIKTNSVKDKQKAEQILKQLRELKLLKSIEEKQMKLKRAKNLRQDLNSRQNSDKEIQIAVQLRKKSSKTSLQQPLIQPYHQLQVIPRKGSLDSSQLIQPKCLRKIN